MICKFCNTFCFILIDNHCGDNEKKLKLKKRGVSALATCDNGAKFDKKLLGVNAMDLIELTEQEQEIFENARSDKDGLKWAIFGTNCLWWTTDSKDVDNTGQISSCPFCGGPLNTADLRRFLTGHAGNDELNSLGGIEILLKAHHDNCRTCRTRWERYEVKIDG